MEGGSEGGGRRRRRRRRKKRGGATQRVDDATLVDTRGFDGGHAADSERTEVRRKRGGRKAARKWVAREPSHSGHFADSGECKSEESRASATTIVDGSLLEGGGQVLRNCLSLSALLRTAIVVRNVRGGRTKPGLKRQHLAGINLVARICGGQLKGNVLNSTEVAYTPATEWRLSAARRLEYAAAVTTAGSVCLLLQIAMPCLLFGAAPSRLTLDGGTNASFAPQIDYTKHVFAPTVERLFGVRMQVEVCRRGFFPKGGGKVVCQFSKVSDTLPPFEMCTRGKVVRICVIAVVSLLEKAAAIAMANSARDTLRRASKHLFDLDHTAFDAHFEMRALKEDGFDRGSGCVVFVQTDTGVRIGGSALGRFGRKGEEPVEVTGKHAAEDLIHEWMGAGVNESCADRHLQDQLLVFMALANGRSQLVSGPLTMHSKTAIHFCQQITGAKFTVKPLRKRASKCVLIECEGIGFRNPFAKH